MSDLADDADRIGELIMEATDADGNLTIKDVIRCCMLHIQAMRDEMERLRAENAELRAGLWKAPASSEVRAADAESSHDRG